MSVKDVALPLAEAEAAAKQEAVRAAQQALRERNERGAYVLEHSPLPRWFPEATFDIVDFTGVGTSLQYQSDGRDIVVESDDGVMFGLHMDLDTSAAWTERCVVAVVKLVEPSPAYAHDGCYYSGTEVKSPLDVGRVLLAWGES